MHVSVMEVYVRTQPTEHTLTQQIYIVFPHSYACVLATRTIKKCVAHLLYSFMRHYNYIGVPYKLGLANMEPSADRVLTYQ